MPLAAWLRWYPIKSIKLPLFNMFPMKAFLCFALFNFFALFIEETLVVRRLNFLDASRRRGSRCPLIE